MKRKPPPESKRAADALSKQELQRKASFRGFLRYIQRDGASVREIWESERIEDDDEAPYIKDVYSFSAFQAVAIDGKWRHRRKEHWVEVRSRVLDHAKSAAVQAEIAEIEALEALKGMVFQRITGDEAAGISPAQPKSLEGAVGAYVQIDKRIGAKRSQVVTEAADVAATGSIVLGSGTQVILPEEAITDSEIEAMARALTTERVPDPLPQEEPTALPSILPEKDDGNG